jgi:hypothetical protein
MKDSEKNNVNKIYCEKCNDVFESREKFDKHFEKHSSVSCESCPLDVAVEKITKLFRRIKAD